MSSHTSGSTGQPKGVQIEHRSLINCLCSVGQQVGLTENDVLLAVTTISFDIAALELFLPLIIGGTVVLASRDETLHGRQMPLRLKKSRATVMQATPSGWKILLDGGWRGKKNFKILCGGEVLSPELADKLLEGGALLWNLYGPTETTIWSTVTRVERAEGPVLLGRPINNTQIHILDSHLQPVPVGVHGELYIGGDGIARGYLNHPELTAERFILNPFSDESGSRLYRTGDLARFRLSGNIEFLGRIDSQVKIRGYRVELGEIEAALNQNPGIKESLLVALEDPKDEAGKTESRNSRSKTQLVAYVVSNKGQLNVSMLRDFLKQKLPEYMVPSAFLMLEALPRTANGKVDRQKLPMLDGVRPELIEEFVLPRTEVEELIAQVWKDVLKVDKIGVHDNFFDLGGHSLLAIRVLARVRDIFQKDVTLRDFFESPTVAALAEKVKEIAVGKRRRGLPPITRAPRQEAFPLSLSQKQLWTMDQLLPGTFFLNMPYAFRLVGSLNVEALRRSLQEIVRRHEAFQMVFREIKGRPVQFVGHVPNIEVPIVDLRHLPPKDRDKEFTRISTDDAELPFDLEEGPPFRVQVIRMADTEHVLLLTVHHIVCDQWSMRVFRRELIVLYQAFSRGRLSPLSKVPIQFIDFVCWQRDLLKRRLLKEQLSYWKKQLAGPLPSLRFQKNHGHGKKLTFGTSNQAIEIDLTLLTELKELARIENCTLFMVLLAVLDIVLYLRTGQKDVWVGTTVTNRSRMETEDVIGNCLNAVILRAQLSPNMTFKHLLTQIKEISLGALSHQELPFGHLAQVLAREKPNMKARPLFQVMFIYQNRTFESLELPGLTFASWDGKYRGADPDVILSTLDLIFDLREASTKLTGHVTYKTAVIEHQVVSEMIESFFDITKRVIALPNRSISDLLYDVRVKAV